MEPHFQFFRSSAVKYYTCGRGEPLFLLHGYQADSGIWKKMIPFLENEFELIIPDLPGHGGSPLIQTTNTMEFLADVIYSIAFSKGFQGISIAGHSMGGYLALAFAERHPNMLDRLFIINAHPFADGMTKLLARNREAELIMDGRKELLLRGFVQNNFSPSRLTELKEELTLATKIALAQPEKGMLADIAGMMVRSNKVRILERAHCKINLIIGEDDKIFPFREIEELNIPKINFHWLKQCGHVGILEKPKEIASIILND